MNFIYLIDIKIIINCILKEDTSIYSAIVRISNIEGVMR